MTFYLGQVLHGDKSGRSTIFKLECETCGPVATAHASNERADPDGVMSVRPACDRCDGTVQVFMRVPESNPEGS